MTSVSSGSRLVSIALLCAVATCGCGGGPAAAPTASSTALSAKEGGPIAGLRACQPPPTSATDARVAGMVLPPGAVVTKVERGSRLVTVHGYIPVTPVRIRQYYRSRTDLKIFDLEDEVTEAEAFVSNGTHRTYLKARAVCAEGSSLMALVAPEVKK